MSMFILQSAFLLLLAYLAGCVLGWILRRLFGGPQAVDEGQSQ
ncbi:MAG: hypothetical protein AAF423_13080 [Pseudomonadota bacterium]